MAKVFSEEMEAARKYQNEMVDKRDGMAGSQFWWYGWALRDAFVTGVKWAKAKKKKTECKNPECIEGFVTRQGVGEEIFQIKCPDCQDEGRV